MTNPNKRDPMERALVAVVWLTTPILAVLGVYGVILLVEYFHGGFGSHC